MRGLYYQVDRAQGKLTTLLSGAIFDVVVDIRKDLPTYAQGLEKVNVDQACWMPEVERVANFFKKHAIINLNNFKVNYN